MKLELVRLTSIDRSSIITLMNNPLVRRQMPLLKGDFSITECEQFIMAKEQLWQEHGYGPWAFLINQEFAGWGGLQAENGEADFALVLHPNYWGHGKFLFNTIVKKAFNEMNLDSITILLPTTRTRVQAIFRLGFKEEKKLTLNNESFTQYRLTRIS